MSLVSNGRRISSVGCRNPTEVSCWCHLVGRWIRRQTIVREVQPVGCLDLQTGIEHQPVGCLDLQTGIEHQPTGAEHQPTVFPTVRPRTTSKTDGSDRMFMSAFVIRSVPVSGRNQLIKDKAIWFLDNTWKKSDRWLSSNPSPLGPERKNERSDWHSQI